MTDFASLRVGATRAVLTAVALTALTAAGSSAVWTASATASGTNTSGANGATESVLQAQAQQLASQLDADGRTLDQLSEALDAAQIRNQQLNTRLVVLRVAMAKTQTRVVTDRANLRRQAVLAYLTGGAPLTEDIPPAAVGEDTNLAVPYAEIVARREQRTLSAYQGALADQTRQAGQLTQALHQSAIVVIDLRADRSAAVRAFADRQADLALVKGRLAVLVAQVQANQRHDEQSAIEATLARQGQSLPTTAGAGSGSSSSHSTTSTTARRPSAPATGTTPARPTSRSTTATPPVTRRTTTPSNPPPPTTRPPTPRTAPGTTPRTPPATTPRTTPPTTRPTPPPTIRPTPPPSNVPAPGWRTAVAYAYAQLGKPYRWGGAGPDNFDCSGLVMRAWDAAGVYFPHLAQYQYDLTERIPLSDALPGDLIFYGTASNVYHVGIYIGGGEMIDAPETGQNVSISSIYWSGLLGAGRVSG